jgi:hypothetical protein
MPAVRVGAVHRSLLERVVSNKDPRLLKWTPRVLGVALSIFLSVFALDVFEPAKPLGRLAMDLMLHLIPTALVLAMVVLSWRHPGIGGAAFIGLAAAYALMVGFRMDWVIAISIPLVLGVLFLWSWRELRDPRTT